MDDTLGLDGPVELTDVPPDSIGRLEPRLRYDGGESNPGIDYGLETASWRPCIFDSTCAN
jgi:hypothetical protein